MLQQIAEIKSCHLQFNLLRSYTVQQQPTFEIFFSVSPMAPYFDSWNPQRSDVFSDPPRGLPEVFRDLLGR
jgi:hypothetical protein